MLHPINTSLEVWPLSKNYSQTQEYWPITLLRNKGIKNCKFRLKIKRGEKDDGSIHWRNIASKVYIINAGKKLSMWKQCYFTIGTKTHFQFHTCLYERSSQFPWVIKIKRDVITVLHVAHSFYWSITIFQHNPQAHWSQWCICPNLVCV